MTQKVRNESELYHPVSGEVIFSYTRANALADGILVDATSTAKEAGLRYAVALTSSEWSQYVSVPDGVDDQDESGRLWDVVWMLLHGIRQLRTDTTELTFQLYVKNSNNLMPELVCQATIVPPIQRQSEFPFGPAQVSAPTTIRIPGQRSDDNYHVRSLPAAVGAGRSGVSRSVATANAAEPGPNGSPSAPRSAPSTCLMALPPPPQSRGRPSPSSLARRGSSAGSTR
jgi:hypothetical protein